MFLKQSSDIDPEVAWHGHYDFPYGVGHPAADEWGDRILQSLWTAAERYTHLVFYPTSITEEALQRRFDAQRPLLEVALDHDADEMVRALTEHLHANVHANEVRIRDHIRRFEANA